MASEDETHSVNLSLEGLPTNYSKGTVSIRATRMRDLVVTPLLQEQADSNFWVEVPSVPVLITAKYLSLDPLSFLEGSVLSYSQEEFTIPFKAPIPKDTKALKIIKIIDFPEYPPEHGRAIGYKDEFFVSMGPGSSPEAERGLSEMVATHLVENACSDAGDNSYVVVDTLNARARAQVEDEIIRQHSPDFDQDTIVEPHFIFPTHTVHGGYIFEGDNVSIGLWIEDGAGNKIATAASSGPKNMIPELVEIAVNALAKEACEGKPWEGTITVEQHDSGHIPDASDPRKPGADFTSDLSVTCSFVGDEGDCTANSGGSLIGNGASIVTNASGGGEAYASVSVVNGEVFVSIGIFRIKGSQSVSVGGASSTAQIEVDIGPFSAKQKASGTSDSESGSFTEGKRTISWSAKR